MESSVSAAVAAVGCSPELLPERSSAVAGRITIDVQSGLDLSPADLDAFDSLIQSRPDLGVFLSRAWLTGLFEERPDRSDAMLLLLRDGKTLRGAAPIAVRRGRAQVTVTLLGGGVGSDRVDLLTARGFETVCSDAFMAWLADTFGRRGYVLELRDVPAESSVWGAIHRANAESGRLLAFQPRDLHTLPYLDLADSRSAATSSLAKHRRWLERRGRLRVDTLDDCDEALAASESLTAFLHARWQSHPGGSALDPPHQQRFHRRAIPLLLRDGHLRMIRLSSDMRTIAVFYGLAIGAWRGYYLAGYDREWAGRIHLGKLTLAAAIDAAAREGATEFDFLKGVERVKYLWPVRERSTLGADIYSQTPASQFSRAVRAAREAAGAFVKSARGLASRAPR